MDLIDDFEMKPITEGLGFHKKAVSLKRSTETSTTPAKKENSEEASVETLQRRFQEMDDLVRELDAVSEQKSASRRESSPMAGWNDDLVVSEPLPKAPEPQASAGIGTFNWNEEPSGQSINPSRPMPEINEAPLSRSEIPSGTDFIPSAKTSMEKATASADIGARRGASDSLIRPLRPAAVSFASAALDSLVILALSLIFFVSLLVVTGVDLMEIVKSAQSEFSVQLSVMILYVSIMLMYTVISRSFFGRTLGEWTFDHQMGDDEQIKSLFYPLKVAWRSIFNLMTGIVLLPMISFMVDKDVTKSFTGLQLYKKNI